MTLNRNFDSDLPPLGIERRYSSPQPVPASRIMIDRFVNPLDGSPEMAVDGSVVPVSFRAKIPLGFDCLVLQAQFFICDTGLRPSRFGGLTALTNGCKIAFRNVSDEVIILAGAQAAISDGFGYKTNAEWINSAGTNFRFWDGGANDGVFAWDYPFSELGLSIELLEDEYMEMLIRDDLTGLDSFQGSIVARLVGQRG